MNHSGNFSEDPAGSAPAATWVITDGAAGTRAQGLALAEAVGLPYRLHELRQVRLPLPPSLQRFLPAPLLLREAELDPPLSGAWPRLVISVGKRSAPIALAVKRASGATFAVHIHDPKLPLRLFDLVAIPEHDGVTGQNVIPTHGSLHAVTEEKLADAAKRFAQKLDSLPQPRIAVLLGGKSNAFDFPVKTGQTLGRKLSGLAKEFGGSLLVTPSYRTPPDAFAALKDEIDQVPAFVYDGEGENPYLAFLAAADAIVVTEDSVNMVTEAAGTGKPVYVEALPGKSKRLGRFHLKMREDGITRIFEGTLETWSYPPVRDTDKVAARVREALGV
ncbi:mitochondrial fission ELM1 family protein [Methyloligella solikamskensis]|uniref:Mitochondrial fission ELM1 family protein n=1 Tax=Methyloligella solikamskensis TaxID=1177756 RepID=A0ABW3J8X2_9HYPH